MMHLRACALASILSRAELSSALLDFVSNFGYLHALEATSRCIYWSNWKSYFCGHFTQVLCKDDAQTVRSNQICVDFKFLEISSHFIAHRGFYRDFIGEFIGELSGNSHVPVPVLLF
jgi:hypothetical protein